MSVAAPLTTPEEAQAFLSAMRDKQKAQQAAAPPANLSRDGMDAWYSQQKQREQEMKKRRQEAESLLRGYRSSYIPNKEKKEGTETLKIKSLSEKATSLAVVREAMADPDSDIYEHPPTLGIQRRIISSKIIEGDTSKTPTAADNGARRTSFSEVTVDTAVKQKPIAQQKAMPEQWRDFIEPGTHLNRTFP